MQHGPLHDFEREARALRHQANQARRTGDLTEADDLARAADEAAAAARGTVPLNQAALAQRLATVEDPELRRALAAFGDAVIRSKRP